MIIIVVVAERLYKIDFQWPDINNLSFTYNVTGTCLMSTIVTETKICSYAWAVAAVSIVVTLLISLLLVSPCAAPLAAHMRAAPRHHKQPTAPSSSTRDARLAL